MDNRSLVYLFVPGPDFISEILAYACMYSPDSGVGIGAKATESYFTQGIFDTRSDKQRSQKRFTTLVTHRSCLISDVFLHVLKRQKGF